MDRLTVEAGGRSLELAADLRENGEDVVVLLHGLGCDRTTWRHAPEHLGGVTLLAPDLPGFGETAAPAGFPHAMESHAEVIDALLARFPARRLHIVAHSMAGAIALLLPPETLARVATFANVEGNLVAADCALASRKAAEADPEEFEREIFPRWRRKLADDEGRYLALSRCPARAFHGCARSLVAWSDGGRLLGLFRALPGRRIYVYGAQNREMPVLAELAGIETVEIPGSGHFPMVDRPREFYATLAGFLGG